MWSNTVFDNLLYALNNFKDGTAFILKRKQNFPLVKTTFQKKATACLIEVSSLNVCAVRIDILELYG